MLFALLIKVNITTKNKNNTFVDTKKHVRFNFSLKNKSIINY